MNGAEAVLATLADCGVETCFANPGTSEMQMVAAFDREPRVRPILCLFEGVATGAADGYARIAGKPAATLLHLGPGLSNGSANLHNARRAGSPVVNIVGDHAVHHARNDAPLASDIEGLSRPVSVWTRAALTADDAAEAAAEAAAASLLPRPGPATLVLPADCAWSPASGPARPRSRAPRLQPPPARVRTLAAALKAAKAPVLLLGSGACTGEGLSAAGRVAAAGVRVMVDTFVGRLPRGAGRFAPERVLYFGEAALSDLEGADLMVLAGTREPVAFFAYPDLPTVLVPPGCATATLASPEEDAPAALAALAAALEALAAGPVVEREKPAAPAGELNSHTVGDSLARHMPHDAVVSDDAVTAGLPVFTRTRGARPHDWLMLTGGAIGQGLPVAVGAAVARPTAKVVSLNGDGAAAYTLQALWTMAREKLDVTAVVFANRRYRILDIELKRTRSGEAGSAARRLLDLSAPVMDWVALAAGFGVAGVRVDTAEGFDAAFARAMAEPGPVLIEAVLR